MRSLWESKTYPYNAANLLECWFILKRAVDLYTFNRGSVGQRAGKLLTAQVEPFEFGAGSTPTGAKSLSKFDRWQLCSPLTFRSYTNCVERSKTLSQYMSVEEAGSISSLCFTLSKWWHFNSVYLLRGQFVLLSIVAKKYDLPYSFEFL